MEADAALAPEDPNWVLSVAQNQRNIKNIVFEDLITLEQDLGIAEKVMQ